MVFGKIHKLQHIMGSHKITLFKKKTGDNRRFLWMSSLIFICLLALRSVLHSFAFETQSDC